MSQYTHDRWGTEQGFVGGAVFAICQSPDGYLWIGTERGLVRFDGIDFTLMQRPVPGSPAIGAVRSLVTDADGTMWVRLDGPRLLRYRNREFDDALAGSALQELALTSISLDREGRVILSGLKNGVMRFKDGKFTHDAASKGIPGIVISAAETRDHKTWIGTRDIGLFQIDHGQLMKPSKRLDSRSINALLPAGGDGLWIGTDAGLSLWDGHAVIEPILSRTVGQRQVLALTGDKDGNVWVGSDHGLGRMTPALKVSNELMRNAAVTAVYEDRDGGIWFGGTSGLERLRDGLFTPFSIAQGLPAENNGSLYVDSPGRTWFAPLTGGLYWLKDGEIGHVRNAGLDKDLIYSISGGDGEIWLGRQHGGLTMLTQHGGSFVSRTYTKVEGLAQDSVYSVYRDRDGTVWAGTVNAGISRLKEGVFTTFSASNGLASNAIFSIAQGSDGTMWFGTSNGLEAYSDGHWKIFGTSDGLPSSNVRSIFEDSKHVLWIATAGGLAMLNSGRIEVPHSIPNSMREEILGITEDKEGFLWIVTSDHVLQVSRDRLLEGRLTDSDVLSYGTEDGLPAVEGVRRDRSLIADASGRIWISLAHGLAMADPVAAAARTAPVTVRIESISAEGAQLSPDRSSRLAAGTHSITFNYAASNLSTPQRIRFRYRLDGSDQVWSGDVPLRQVVYTNLGPGAYRFRIEASNTIGSWNGPETVLPLFVEPAFWQTWWFRAIFLFAFSLLIVIIYRWRMTQMTHYLNVRFHDRLAERTRIAQDLHDTLLQGVLSARLQLDLVEDRTPADAPTKPLIGRVLQLMGQVTEEGRTALRGLRMPESQNFDLETALSRLQQEFAVEEKTTYRVIVYGVSRSLRAMVRDDVYRISREAVVNCFLHAQADHIEVEVEYANRYLRILVRDDGCGIDPRVLDTGLEGHWGLPGMRERSEGIGSVLKLWSRVGAGTEIELTVPASIAFDGDSFGTISRWMTWLGGEKNRMAARNGRKRTKK